MIKRDKIDKYRLICGNLPVALVIDVLCGRGEVDHQQDHHNKEDVKKSLLRCQRTSEAENTKYLK